MTLLNVLIEVQPIQGAMNDQCESIVIPFDKMCFVSAAIEESRNITLGSQAALEAFITKFEEAHNELENDLWEMNHNGTTAQVRAFRAGHKISFDLLLVDCIFQYTFSIMHKPGKRAKLS